MGHLTARDRVAPNKRAISGELSTKTSPSFYPSESYLSFDDGPGIMLGQGGWLEHAGARGEGVMGGLVSMLHLAVRYICFRLLSIV